MERNMDDAAIIADLRRRLAESEAARHQSEARFAAMLESVPAGVATLDINGRILASNSQYQHFCPTGLMPSRDPDRVVRWQAWSDDGRLLRPDEFPGARANRGECVTPGQEMLFTDDDQRAIWVRVAAVPVRDEQGNLTGQASVISDINTLKRSADSLRESEQRQVVMVAELQHRTRNLIAVISSIAARMLDGASSLQEFERSFNDRLSALSRVQKMLSYATAGQRVNFEDLLRAELVALGAIGRKGGDDHLILAGPPDVPLRSRAVQSVALALHELGTNAVKYGALGADGGLLTITWHVETERDGVPWLHVDWRESGVQISRPSTIPPTGGYGRQLIERALPYQLGAKTHYAFVEDGVHCTIAVPVVSRRTLEDAQDG
jgi:two-component sensor histidine kinase